MVYTSPQPEGKQLKPHLVPFALTHPRMDEVRGLSLLLVHQRKADEYSNEILP